MVPETCEHHTIYPSSSARRLPEISKVSPDFRHGRDVRVRRDGRPVETVRGELLKLETRPGEALPLEAA
jgi:hypothetical protein